jgi:hypothetical protein
MLSISDPHFCTLSIFAGQILHRDSPSGGAVGCRRLRGQLHRCHSFSGVVQNGVTLSIQIHWSKFAAVADEYDKRLLQQLIESHLCDMNPPQESGIGGVVVQSAFWPSLFEPRPFRVSLSRRSSDEVGFAVLAYMSRLRHQLKNCGKRK